MVISDHAGLRAVPGGRALDTVTTQSSYSIPIHSYPVPKQLAPFLYIPVRSYPIPIQCKQERNCLGTFLQGSYGWYAA